MFANEKTLGKITYWVKWNRLTADGRKGDMIASAHYTLEEAVANWKAQIKCGAYEARIEIERGKPATEPESDGALFIPFPKH